jgi:hypothetical protein
VSITALSVRNFRSIALWKEKVHELNIFVGQNDEGKSNVLRALDLFFNHDKGGGYRLEWGRDYCCFAPILKGKADEIVIEIEVTPPSSFANRNPVVWRKTWRREGLHYDSFKHKDGTEVSPKSKIASFLKAMRYDYVPAIKGGDYFKFLMAQLHDMLEATVEEEVRTAAGLFTNTINGNTKRILEEIQQRLNLETTIQLPGNLRELFAQLEFTSVSGEKPFSLGQRGDGVKVRHIPIVLRWLAEQANHLSAPGRPKTVTIWGYEEPENNLELRRCFELAREFVDGSSEIQAFVTTHSPAFYSVFRESDLNKVGLFLVVKETVQPTSKIRPLADTDLDSLDSSMGLLALLEPHFKEARHELEKLRLAVKDLTDTSKPTIFCEGPSDKAVIKECLRLFFPNESSKVAVRSSSHHGGGHTWVGEMIIAWSFSRPLAKAVGLFDKDSDALKTMKTSIQKLNNPPSGKKAFGIDLKPGNELKVCYSYHIAVPYALEELFPEDVWTFAENEGWLEDRAHLITLYKFDRRDITFDEYLSQTLPEKHLQRLAVKKVMLEKKEHLAKHVCSMPSEAERMRILEGFKPTLEECLKQLDVI